MFASLLHDRAPLLVTPFTPSSIPDDDAWVRLSALGPLWQAFPESTATAAKWVQGSTGNIEVALEGGGPGTV